ncbi:MAG: carbohydrate esterase [Alphaproteobacteria bacterium]|nr:carbohydrate esterase [Alphaproteobacteria bacterium]
MRGLHILGLLMTLAACTSEPVVSPVSRPGAPLSFFPASGARNVNPDTHLVLTFASEPKVGDTGLIRIYDAKDNALVDTLDLSIPTSPNPSGRGAAQVAGEPPPKAAVISDVYQETDVGGQPFHFRPIIVHGKTATIYPHNHALSYGHTYVVRMDPSVLTAAEGDFAGLNGEAWTFATKPSGPAANATRVSVSADGRGDFSTVQGAIDFFPATASSGASAPREISIRKGDYEEIVSINGKSNLILRGEDREGVKVGYANNTPFNPQRRWAFSIINGADIQLSNFTLNNYAIGQAEALMTRGEHIILDHMTLNGSGDAMTTYGTLYMADSKLTGDGDTILGYAAAYYLRTEVRSKGPITWTRNPEGSHGNVFVDSTLIGVREPLPWTVTQTDPGRIAPTPFARLPHNGKPDVAANFPYAEMVLINCRTQNIPPEGWGPIEENGPLFSRANLRFMEYNTMDLDGRPVDTSMRTPVSRQLTLPKDAQVIANYSNPEFVLGGWKPVVR